MGNKSDNSYINSKVYLKRDADRLCIDSDGYFDFFTTTVDGNTLKKMLYSNQQKTTIYSSNVVLSDPNLPQNGFVFLVLSVGCSNISAWLPACSAGDELTVVIHNYLVESVLSVFISLSGCSLVGQQYADLSNVGLHTSDDSAGILRLKSFSDGEWSVVGNNYNKVVEHASA